MGQGKPSHFSNNSLKKFQENYTFHTEKIDERWGAIQVWEEKDTRTQIMVFSKSCHSDEDYKLYQEELKLRQSLDHPHMLKLIGWSGEDHEGLCGHSRKYNLYTEYLSQNLEKEIKRRSSHNVEKFLIFLIVLGVFPRRRALVLDKINNFLLPIFAIERNLSWRYQTSSNPLYPRAKQ